MIDQIFSWATLLTVVGLTGFHFVGKKLWWAWYINIACQFLWFTYAIVSEQYAFIFASCVYFIVFSNNAIKWTREHRNRPQPIFHNPKFDVSLLFDNAKFVEGARISQMHLESIEAMKAYQGSDVKSLKHLGADLENVAFERGVRWAMNELQAGYTYGDMPDWRQDGVDWLTKSLTEWKQEHPDQ